MLRLVLAWADAGLAFERPGEVRQVIEADGVSHLLGERALHSKAFAGTFDAVVQQILAEANAMLLLENPAKPGRAESAQRGSLL